MSKVDMSQYWSEAKKKEVAEQQKSIRISKKWAIFMVCCSFLYLFPEAIFNSMLVTVVGGADKTPYSREDVEIFGRAISGIGVTLLVADLLIGRLYKRGNLKGLTAGYFYLICIGVLTWPTVYFGQKWLIDEYLIHPSTAEERQFAMFSQMVKSGVIENAIEIDGIPFNADDDLTPQEMSFLGVFPSLMYVNDSAFRNIKSQQSTIASKYFQNKFYGGFDKYY